MVIFYLMNKKSDLMTERGAFKEDSSWIVYDKLLRKFPIVTAWLYNPNYKLHTELSKRPNYYEEIFKIDPHGLIINMTHNKIYEIVFQDIKNVPTDFDYFGYFSYYDITTEFTTEKTFDFLIFFTKYISKNKIQTSTVDVGSDKIREEIKQEIKRKRDAAENEIIYLLKSI